MRDIKFRGHNGSRWIYSESIWFNKFPTLNDIMVYMYDEEDENQDDLNIETWDSVCYLGQYTGLKDKNGKEIYEGDIFNTDKNNKYEVIFKDGGFKLSNIKHPNQNLLLLDKMDSNYGEVIGNIYENKDLLGK